MAVAARYFDGFKPVAHAVVVAHDARGLAIRFENGAEVLWSPGDIRMEREFDSVRLHRVRYEADTGERLVIAASDFDAHFSALASSFGKGRAGEASRARIALWSVAAVASILLLFFVGLPVLARVVAPMVPWSWEVSLGKSVEPQVLEMFGKPGKPVRLCTGNPAGEAALQALVDKLAAHAKLPGPLHVSVVDTPVPNAFALPGGRIMLFRPILEKAQGPDEVAGVLAHEIGHVIHRDAMRALIHDAALSVLAGMILGDVSGGGMVTALGKMLAGSAYSRDKEREADVVSVELLEKAGANPSAINSFFRRMTELEGKSGSTPLDAFRSHPITSERIARVEALAGSSKRQWAPVLDATRWAALKGICGPAT